LIGKKIILAAVGVVVVAVAVIVFSMQLGGGGTSIAAAPNVKFVSFDSDKKDIKVGETSNVFFNVHNLEDRSIRDAKVLIMIEPSGYEPYISLSNQSVKLPQLLGKDAASGEIKVSITATAPPAKEAVYVVKGILVVEGVQTDTRQFDLKINQF